METIIMSKKTHLIIAGHGTRRNGIFDPGAAGYITKGEHRYMKENLFPSMKKYAGSNFIFYSERNVRSYGDIVSLARRYNADSVTEIHFDATGNETARSGHVIIYSHYNPDGMDLRIRDAIRLMTGVRYNHAGQEGISGRSNLANVNRAASGRVNYRMVELGFGTNQTDANILLNQTDEYAKKLVEAIEGSKITSSPTPIKPSVSKPNTSSKSVNTLAHEVIAGKHGGGAERRKALGGRYEAVQSEVNRILIGSATVSKPKPKLKSNSVIAKEVIAGVWGNGNDRKTNLERAGYNYNTIQAEVNRQAGGGSRPSSKKSASQVADEIYRGKGNWSNGAERSRKLKAAGYNPNEVQRLINLKFR